MINYLTQQLVHLEEYMIFAFYASWIFLIYAMEHLVLTCDIITVSSHANVPPQSKHKQTIHYILNVDIFTVYFLGKISKKLSKIHINGVLTTLLLYMQISLSLI